ncbi:MAG: hypothetical protein NXI30_03750 [bacterium]|nr:hypothetical protein [bacterium]
MLYHGLVLAGIYLMVSGIADLAHIPINLSPYDSELKKFVVPDEWFPLAAAGIAAHFVFGVLPGALLIRLARPVADRFASDASIESYGFSDSGLYVVLLLVLAIFFLVVGLAQVVVGLTQLLPELMDYDEYSMLRFGIGPLGAGLMQVFAAVAIYYHSLGAVRPAA